MIISSLFGDQIQFTCMKIIGIIAAICSLQSIVIAFLKPDSNWIPWFRGFFLSRGYNAYFIIPIRLFSLYTDFLALLDFSHDWSTKSKILEDVIWSCMGCDVARPEISRVFCELHSGSTIIMTVQGNQKRSAPFPRWLYFRHLGNLWCERNCLPWRIKIHRSESVEVAQIRLALNYSFYVKTSV